MTFGEWDACVAAGGCKYKPDDQGWGRGKQPVINVSWDDITNEYLPWLSLKTGKTYRLLTEAEWEYVARAGTTTPFWWGTSISTNQANYYGKETYGGGPKGEYRQKTMLIDSFATNQWGLHNVHGNVWEWVHDCWNGTYSGAPCGEIRNAELAAFRTSRLEVALCARSRSEPRFKSNQSDRLTSSPDAVYVPELSSEAIERGARREFPPLDALAAQIVSNPSEQLPGLQQFDDGQALLRVAEQRGLEGVLSKRRDAPNCSGECRDWRKIKTMAWRVANRERWRLFERD